MKNLLFSCLIFYSLSLSAQRWESKSDIPSGRDAAISFTLNGKIYFGGGGTQGDFWAYNPDSDTWTQKADLPNSTSGRGFAVAFTIGKYGYMGTGTNNSFTKLYNDFWMYDPDSDKWTQKADYPAGGRDAVAAFVLNGKAYAGGGTDNNYVYGEFYQYDPVKDKWTSKIGMPSGSTAFAMAFSVGGNGYICGGAGSTEYKTLYQFDTTNNTWIKKADFPAGGRQAGIGFTIGDKAYVGLGMSGYSTAYKDLYSYDPAKNTWTKSAELSAGSRAWSTVAVLNDKAYVGGGWDLVATSMLTDWKAFVSDSAATGINKASMKLLNISLYPNPANEQINITLPEYYKGTINIMDLSGKSFITTTTYERNTRIDVSTLPKGIFILTYTNKDGVANAKFTRQ